jgi:phytoene synthase
MTPDEYCQRKAAESGSSFYYSFLFLPPERRRAITALYAFCREVDDVVDECSEPALAATKLAWWRQEIAALEQGQPQHPVTQALAPLARAYGITRERLGEIIDGMEMDLRQSRYPDLAGLERYCYHVAGVVGLMMAHVMEVQDDWALQRAADLGIALQLTNVARDVMDDARHGRVYLPLEWLAEAGVSPDEIAAPGERRRVARVVARLLDEAERFYASGEEGLRALPFRSAWAVAAARAVYREIGRLVRERGAGAWERRVIVSRPRKLARVAGAFVDAALAAGVGRFRACAPRPDLWRKRAPELD